MGNDAVAGDLDGSVCLQVCPVSKQGRVPSDGLLCLRRQRRGRNPEVQHGFDITTSMPEHHYLAQKQDQIRDRCSVR